MNKLSLSFLARYIDVGQLIIRVGLGGMFIAHGLPKLVGGVERWEAVGSAMANLGITFAPAFWGLSAALAETVGGALLILGLFMRPACVFLLFTMIVASIRLAADGSPFSRVAHPVEMAITFLALTFIGPGKYSLDHWITERKQVGKEP